MQKAHYKKIVRHFKSNDPILYQFLKNLDFDEWMNSRKRATSKNDYFRALCREIVGQQLSGKAANAIWKRFTSLFQDKKLMPKHILNSNDQMLRDVGISWAKVKYIKNLAGKVKTRELVLDNLDSLSDIAIVKNLTMVKGIGSWTAEMFLIFALGRENVFSFGDLGLKKGIEKV